MTHLRERRGYGLATRTGERPSEDGPFPGTTRRRGGQMEGRKEGRK
jgi:hypothetical protein